MDPSARALRLRAASRAMVNHWRVVAGGASGDDTPPLPPAIATDLLAVEQSVPSADCNDAPPLPAYGPGADPFVDDPFMPYVEGYPAAPFLNLVCDRLVEWQASGTLPVHLPPMDGYVETGTPADIVLPLAPTVFPLVDAIVAATPDPTPIPVNPTPSRADAAATADTGATPDADAADVPDADADAAVTVTAAGAGAGGGAGASTPAFTPPLPPAACLPDVPLPSADVQRLVTQVYAALGVAGVACLLGLRTTVGSVRHRLPLPRSVLLQVFTKPFKPKVKLSVGARALSKHAHRSSESFWGECKGPEATKNAVAYELITALLSKATWINAHTLPHDQWVVECRVAEGYGARWLITADPDAPPQFRGLLEPWIADGHTKGWRH